MEATPNRKRRIALVAIGALAVALIAALAITSRTPTQPEIEYVGGGPDQVPDYAPPPQELAAALGVTIRYVSLTTGGGFAPGDCTRLGPVATQEKHGYKVSSEEPGLAIATAAQLADATEASALIDRIRSDIEDCDRSEHPSFAHDLEEVRELDVGDRAFLLAAINDEGSRACWIWAQQEHRVAHVGVTGFDPAPTIEDCAAAGRVTTEALGES